ncbi:HI0933-like protein [Seminavis robusta]|uniref:HI0933-like protein n=1 Tax=Seminavis robusta TaxID=568900 RepID=A0A9N8EN45_9STRA|nr:HI0933-like protein [Seminavis robusta]|eukprot:Sro1368_g266830.1 HI0933-like protein (550) ;mRNA; f:22349-23998
MANNCVAIRLMVSIIGFLPTSSITLRSVSALSSHQAKRIAVIGGGASGIFSAISAAEHFERQNNVVGSPPLEIVVLEATSKTLTKVAISGGGRCNVLHDTSKSTAEILNGYPRGKKELTGLLSSRFTPQQAQAWFQKQGVELKTEPDGRMFPITDDSQTVIDALLSASSRKGLVDIRKRQKVLDIGIPALDPDEQRSHGPLLFEISTQQKDKTGEKKVRKEHFDAIVLATGSAPAGYQLAQSILEQSSSATTSKKNGTKPSKAFVSPVPSLFTMNTKLDVKEEGCLLHGLAGVSVPKARVTFRPEESSKKDATITSQDDGKVQQQPKKRKRSKKTPPHLQQEGPLLVTHHGVSGPAVLRLSAFGARDFHEANYRGTLRIHWAPDLGTVDEILDSLKKKQMTNPKRMVATGCPLTVTGTVKESSGFVEKRIAAIPKRLWSSFVIHGCGIDPTTTWAEINKKAVRKLATFIAECDLQVTGKGTFKEEFVTAGGVALKEIDMKTMMSKSCPGFFLCGEVINVDGVTGGFNFMNCWGTGHVAGTSAVDYVLAA